MFRIFRNVLVVALLCIVGIYVIPQNMASFITWFLYAIAMTLQYVLNQHGYRDGENITMNYDVPFALTGPSFVSGTGDYVALFEPTASELEKEKRKLISFASGWTTSLKQCTIG